MDTENGFFYHVSGQEDRPSYIPMYCKHPYNVHDPHRDYHIPITGLQPLVLLLALFIDVKHLAWGRLPAAMCTSYQEK